MKRRGFFGALTGLGALLVLPWRKRSLPAIMAEMKRVRRGVIGLSNYRTARNGVKDLTPAWVIPARLYDEYYAALDPTHRFQDKRVWDRGFRNILCHAEPYIRESAFPRRAWEASRDWWYAKGQEGTTEMTVAEMQHLFNGVYDG
ncbi:hypothetical protein LCGC14_2425830 [marine sediment metagenome]|uniref:Uncharacterized protein n=1 Tax=marine sediment metagenome TaxID=412755 RepID=A0A0F9E0F8_9ZZZZ